MVCYNLNLNSFFTNLTPGDMGTSAIVRVVEQCCFNSVPDPFNGQTVNFISKPLKVIESKTYVEKADLEHY